jgi:hypothetical protein
MVGATSTRNQPVLPLYGPKAWHGAFEERERGGKGTYHYEERGVMSAAATTPAPATVLGDARRQVGSESRHAGDGAIGNKQICFVPLPSPSSGRGNVSGTHTYSVHTLSQATLQVATTTASFLPCCAGKTVHRSPIIFISCRSLDPIRRSIPSM